MISLSGPIQKWRVFLLLLPLLALSACSTGEAPEPEAPEKAVVIARVDGRAITRKALDRALAVLMHRDVGVNSDGPGEAPDDNNELGPAETNELKKSILNELIEEELVIKEAEKEGINISAEELDEVISSMMEGMEREAFYEGVIPLYGSIEIWTGEIRRKLLVRKMIEKIKGSVKETTEAAASRYYIRNPKEYKMGEQVHASMILTATEVEAKKVKERLAAGEPFKELAKKVSLGPEGALGGDLGFFGRGEMPEEFEETVFNIPLSLPSDVVKTPYGYHIFLVHKRNKERNLRFEKVKPEIKKKLRARRAEKKLSEWLSSLKKDVDIEILEEI